jgi:HAD superfamily hydrolase (TIGR01490 family)
MNRLPRLEVYRWTFQECARYPIDELIRMLDEAYEQYVLPRLYAEGKERIRWHHNRGHHTVIATAAGEYISEKVRVQLGADGKIAAMAPVRNGRLTDEFDLPLPYGEGKLERARHYAERMGTQLTQCYFYSDSLADLPLLLEVGHPVAVNPQRKLRKMALERGWEILYWRRHLPPEEPSRAEQLSFVHGEGS